MVGAGVAVGCGSGLQCSAQAANTSSADARRREHLRSDGAAIDNSRRRIDCRFPTTSRQSRIKNDGRSQTPTRTRNFVLRRLLCGRRASTVAGRGGNRQARNTSLTLSQNPYTYMDIRLFMSPCRTHFQSFTLFRLISLLAACEVSEPQLQYQI